MGGFLNNIASAAGEGLEKLGLKTTQTLEDSSVGRKALSLVGNKENELKLTPQGQAVHSMLQEYDRVKTTSLNEYTKNLRTVTDWHQADDTARNAVPLKTSTVDDIHQHAVGRQHPIQMATQKLLDQDIDPKTGISRNADLTLKELSLKNKGQARLAALSGSVGDKMQNISPIIASMLEHPDPRVQMNGRVVSDIVSNTLRDTELMKVGSTETEQSRAKVDMNKTFDTVNKFRQKAGVSDQIPRLKTDPTYHKPSDLEQMALKILHTVQIPFVAIPHIGQYFHIPMSSPLSAVGKAMLQMDKANMLKTMEASSILTNTEWDVLHSELSARAGKVAEWTKSPTAASIISKVIHTPGFNWMRSKQLATAGAVGYHSAIFWAHNAMNGDKRSLAELAEMGIDFNEVKQQGGTLNPEQLQKGVYHYVNNRFFFDKSLDRAMWSNKNFFHRSASMYHGFISSETSFLRRELIKQFKAGDIKGIAQYAATLGILFPAVAPMLKSAELLLRTGSPQQAEAEIKKDYSNLSGQNGAGAFFETYIDMIAHIGATGAALNYYSAIKGNRLANAVVGPMIGMGVQDSEDLINAARGKSLAPLGRDLTQLIPVAGKPLSHHFFPTKKESGSSTGRIPRIRRR
jgi:hypothetical protein